MVHVGNNINVMWLVSLLLLQTYVTYYRDGKYSCYIMLTYDTIITGDPCTNVKSNEFEEASSYLHFMIFPITDLWGVDDLQDHSTYFTRERIWLGIIISIYKNVWSTSAEGTKLLQQNSLCEFICMPTNKMWIGNE